MRRNASVRPRTLVLGVVSAFALAGAMLGGGVGSASAHAAAVPTIQCNNDPGFDASNDPRNKTCPRNFPSGRAKYDSHDRDSDDYRYGNCTKKCD